MSSEQMILFENPIDVARLRRAQERLMKTTKAKNTLRCYDAQWRAFEQWCAIAGRSPLPATSDTVALFCTACIEDGDVRLNTIKLRVSTIRIRHRERGLPNPISREVNALIANAARELREAPGGKLAITEEQIERIAENTWNSDSLIDIRDRSIVITGTHLGWRRSELANLCIEHVSFRREGAIFHLTHSKTDQKGTGRKVGLEYSDRPEICPVRALEAWIKVRGKWAGPVYNPIEPAGRRRPRLIVEHRRVCDESILDAVKRQLRAIDVDDRPYGAHSLRSGLVTIATEHGANFAAIMARTGHTSIATVMKYVKPAQAFQLNPLKDAFQMSKKRAAAAS